MKTSSILFAIAVLLAAIYLFYNAVSQTQFSAEVNLPTQLKLSGEGFSDVNATIIILTLIFAFFGIILKLIENKKRQTKRRRAYKNR